MIGAHEKDLHTKQVNPIELLIVIVITDVLFPPHILLAVPTGKAPHIYNIPTPALTAINRPAIQNEKYRFPSASTRMHIYLISA